ncbi:hypothetical protein CCUS01_15508 [Colletotrichum cuscutae]|uniref:Uncharacterized protein n=1 Tax=Colletotrichum cuscutae TaxID=1209917 RepID=A0AAI9Y753_9PEZI|nr:hypothetical protein CCUS01_15508 [Colletotrichum cuscutae]
MRERERELRLFGGPSGGRGGRVGLVTPTRFRDPRPPTASAGLIGGERGGRRAPSLPVAERVHKAGGGSSPSPHFFSTQRLYRPVHTTRHLSLSTTKTNHTVNMPAPEAPQQQAPMEVPVENGIVTQQPSNAPARDGSPSAAASAAARSLAAKHGGNETFGRNLREETETTWRFFGCYYIYIIDKQSNTFHFHIKFYCNLQITEAQKSLGLPSARVDLFGSSTSLQKPPASRDIFFFFFFFLPAVAAFAGNCAMLSTLHFILPPNHPRQVEVIALFQGLPAEGTYSGEMTMDLPSPVFFPSVPRRITTPFPSGRCTLDTLQVAE